MRYARTVATAGKSNKKRPAGGNRQSEIGGLLLDIEEYIRERVDDQIKWYDDKASKAQHKYKLCQVIEIIIAACIPILVNFVDGCILFQVLVALCGVAITIIEGLTALYKWHENWIEYRSTCELLRHEKYLFEMKAPPYGDSSSVENLFVSNIESLISAESNKWKVNNSKSISIKPSKDQSSTGS